MTVLAPEGVGGALPWKDSATTEAKEVGGVTILRGLATTSVKEVMPGHPKDDA